MAGTIGATNRFAVDTDLDAVDGTTAEIELDQLRVAEDQLDWQAEIDRSDRLWRTDSDHGFGIIGADDSARLCCLFVLLSILLNHGDALLFEELIKCRRRNGADYRPGCGADPVGTGKGELQIWRFPIAGGLV